MAMVLTIGYYDSFTSLADLSHLQRLVFPPSPADDWWENRFSEEEKRQMSQLARRIFLSEDSPSPDKKSSHLILMWRYGEGIASRYINGSLENCSVCNCNITYREEDILLADAVVFHLHMMGDKDLEDMLQLPRKPSQRWVFLSDESPQYTRTELNVQFNWSMTYHSASDVPVPYGRVVKNLQADMSDLERNFHGEKELGVAIVASHCDVKSGRFNYLDALQKYIKVDTWGLCGTFQCPGWAITDCTGIEKYKFYLAFENSLCSDYITEKVWWNAYHKFSVPIVMGGLTKGDYAKLAPPDSFIHVDDFNTTSDLAKYINHLDTHPLEYNKYHAWRQQYTVLNEHGYYGAPTMHFCRLCEALKYNNREKKVYSFWNYTTECRGTHYKLRL